MGTGVSCASDKWKPSIMLACLSCLSGAGQQTIPETSTKHAVRYRGGVDHIVWEGISVKQSLFCPGSNWI